MNKQTMSWEEAVVAFRDDPLNAEAVLACFYDDPIVAAAERYHAGLEFKALLKFLPNSPGKLLDLGAGRGISSYAFAKQGWDVTALEPDSSAVVGSGAIRALSEQSGIEISVVEEWGERLPFDDASFDIVHGRAVLHHANDLANFCREAARVTRPGGYFAVIREHVITRHADLDAFLRQHPLHSLYGGENAYTLAEYRSALEQAGLYTAVELNPWASEINLYPETFESLQKRIRSALYMPFPLPLKVLAQLGKWYNKPGRLYSFICQKVGKS